MRILILEDSEQGAAELQRLAAEAVEPAHIEFNVVKSVIDAKSAVVGTSYDIALIDIVVPMRSNEAARETGGLLFLDFILTSPNARRPRYVVGVTSDRSALERADPTFKRALFSIVERNRDDSAWGAELTRFFGYVANVDAAMANRSDATDSRVSLAVVCALHRPEMEAVRNCFGGDWKAMHCGSDTNSYEIGELSTSSGMHRILLVAAHEPGMPVAAALAMKTICRFKPAVVAMSGIAAGLVSGQNMGDILVAEHTWDYTTGKIVKGSNQEADVLPENRGVRCDPTIVDQARRLASDGELLDRIRRNWPGIQPVHRLAAILGPIASGGAVVENAGIAQGIKERDRKTIGLDMEAHGIAVAAWYAPEPRPKVLIAKSVVDYALPPKSDEWHAYASYTSASFIHAWAKAYL